MMFSCLEHSRIPLNVCLFVHSNVSMASMLVEQLSSGSFCSSDVMCRL